jgi:hypothetical protein
MMTHFEKLNENWNADPNSPEPQISFEGADLLLTFYLNAYVYRQFQEGDMGRLRFTDVWRYRMGSTNDEGWYRGQCRFSKLAPAWGEFYEVLGDLRLDDPCLFGYRNDWRTLQPARENSKHYLFYFRDEQFECDASDFLFEPLNA